MQVVVDVYLSGLRELTPPQDTPLSFAPLLAQVRHRAATGKLLFCNGAGKQFLGHIFNLCFLIGEDWVTKSST